MIANTAQSARKRAFLRPAPRHSFSAHVPRVTSPRETALPVAWAVNLAQHVEPRLVSHHSAGALMLIAGLASMAVGFALSGVLL